MSAILLTVFKLLHYTKVDLVTFLQVVLLMGSPSDSAIGDEIAKYCDKYDLNLVRRIMSAHKVTEETLNVVKYVSQ